jgi:uroporphyrinogen-III decarboxylase
MEDRMTSVERAECVLSGGIPDRAPTSPHNFMMSAYASGRPFPEYLQSGEAMAEGGIKAWRGYGQDLVILEHGPVALAQACGCQVEYLAGRAPALVRPVLGSLDEVDQRVMPDVTTAHPLNENLKATRLAAKRIRLAYHICGNATRIMGDRVTTGAALLELDTRCDPAVIKEAVRGKTSGLGVIDPSGVLALGTPAAVAARAREELAILGPGGGFVLSPGCGLPPKTPPENIHALIELAHRYERYHTDGSLVE